MQQTAESKSIKFAMACLAEYERRVEAHTAKWDNANWTPMESNRFTAKQTFESWVEQSGGRDALKVALDWAGEKQA